MIWSKVLFSRLQLLLLILLISVFCFIFYGKEANASGPMLGEFYKRKAEGWHWYEDLGKKKLKEEQQIVDTDKNVRGESKKESGKESLDSDQEERARIAKERIEFLQKDLDEKKYIAIIEPTNENLGAYMQAQQRVMNMSSNFADSWKTALLNNPRLDYTKTFPVDSNARDIYLNKKAQIDEDKIRLLAKDHGLFFFYKADCPYSQKFAPIVKMFERKYNWKVIPITVDGGVFPEFPETRRDNGSVNHLGVKTFPTLFAVNPKSKEVIPLATGYVSLKNIEEQASILISSKKLKELKEAKYNKEKRK